MFKVLNSSGMDSLSSMRHDHLANLYCDRFLRGFPAQPASWSTFEAQLIERLKFYLEEYFNLNSKWVGFEVFIFAPEAVYHQLHSTSFRNIKIIPVDDSFRLPISPQDSQRPEIAQALSLEGTSVAFLAVGEVEESLNFLVGHSAKAVIFSARKDIDRDVTYSGNVRIVPWSKISRLADPAISLEPNAITAPSERAGASFSAEPSRLSNSFQPSPAADWPTTSPSSLIGSGSLPSRDAYVIESPLDVPIERETPTQVQLDLRTLVIAQYFERLQRWGQQQQQQSLSFAGLSCQFLFGEDPSLYSTINPSEMKSVVYVDMDPSMKRYELVIRGISRAFVHLRARIIQEMIADVITFRKVHELVHWDTPHRVAIVGSNFLVDREDALHASVNVHATSNGMFVEILALNPAIVERILGMILALRPTRDVLRTSRASLSTLDKALVEDLRIRFSTVLEIDSNTSPMSRISHTTTKYDDVDVFLWGFEELLVKSRAYLMNLFGPSAALPVPVPPASSRHGHAMRIQPPPSAGSSLFESSYPSDPFRDSLGLGAIGSRAGGSITSEQLSHDPYMSASRDFAADVGAAATASDLLQSRAGIPSDLTPSHNNFDYYAATNVVGANAGHYPRSVSGMSTSSTISSLTTRRETIRKIHRGVYSFADREAGIFFFAFEQQFRDFLEKSFQVLVEDSDNGLDGGMRGNGSTGRMGMSGGVGGDYGLAGSGHGISSAGNYDAEPGSKNVVLKVAFYGNTPKNIASARAYLEQLNTTNLMRTQIYFPQVSARKYKEILNKRASQSTILNNLRLREASQVNPQDTGAILVDPLRTKGFVNIRIKPPVHNQNTKRSGGGGGGGNGQPADVTVTISGSLLTTGNEQFIKDLESEFGTLDDEYMYQVVQIPYSHPMKRQLTIKSLREEIIHRHGLVALKWEEGCRANGSVGTAKIWARSPASMDAILQEIRTAESMHLDAPSLMNASGSAEGRSPIPVELEQDITKDIVTVLDINRTILSMTKLNLSSQPTANSEISDILSDSMANTASMTSFSFNGSRLGVTESTSNQARKVTITTNTNGDAKVVVYLPDLTLRYVLLGPPLSQLMTDMLSRFTANGIKTKYPYRDRTDPHAALLIEGDPTLAVPAAHEALALITSATEELKSVHVIVSEEQHRALLSSDLALIKYIQGQVGVHLKLEPTMAEMEYAHALVDLRFHFKPISVDSVADRAMANDVHPWNTLPTMALARGLLVSLNYRSSSSAVPMEVSVFGAVYGSSGWMDKVQAVVKFVMDAIDDEDCDKVPETADASTTTTGHDAQAEESPAADGEESNTTDCVKEDPVVVPDASSLPSFVTVKRGDGRSLAVTVSFRKKMEQVVEGEDEGRTVSTVLSSVLKDVVQLLTQLKVENVALLIPSTSLLRSLDDSVARPSETIDGEHVCPSVTTPRQFFEQTLDATVGSTLRRLVITQESEPELPTTTTADTLEGGQTAVESSPDANAVTFTLPDVRHFPSTLAVGADNELVRTLLEQFERQDMSWYDTHSKQGHYAASAASRNAPSQSHGAFGGGFGAIGEAAFGTGADGMAHNSRQRDVRLEILACNVPFASSALTHLVTAQPVFSHGLKSFIVKGLLPGVLSGLDLLRAIASPTALVMKAAAASASAANATASMANGSGAMSMHMGHSADDSLYALETRAFPAVSSASLSSISHSTLTSQTSFDAALHSSNSHTSGYAAAALQNKSNPGHYPPSAHGMSGLMGGPDLLGLNYAAADASRRYAALSETHRPEAASSGLSVHSGYGREYYPSNGGGASVYHSSSASSRGHAAVGSSPYMNQPYGHGGYAPSNAYGGGPHGHHHSSQQHHHHLQQPQQSHSRRRYNAGPSGYMGPGTY